MHQPTDRITSAVACTEKLAGGGGGGGGQKVIYQHVFTKTYLIFFLFYFFCGGGGGGTSSRGAYVCYGYDNTHHGLCYTSRGSLVGTRNNSMGPS